MFCSACGKEIPDESTSCPKCGKSFVEISQIKEKETESKSESFAHKWGQFFKDFFASPADAVSKMNDETAWIVGLSNLGLIAFIYFLRFVFDSMVDNIGASFGFFFTMMCALGALFFSLYVFQSLFHLPKKSAKDVLSATGLSLLPMIPIMLVSILLDAAFLQQISFFNIFLNPMIGFACLISALILVYVFADKEESSYSQSFKLVSVSYSAFFVIWTLFSAIIWSKGFF